MENDFANLEHVQFDDTPSQNMDINHKIKEQLRQINGSGSPRTGPSIGELGSLPHNLDMKPSKRKGLKNMPLSPPIESSNVIVINDETV